MKEINKKIFTSIFLLFVIIIICKFASGVSLDSGIRSVLSGDTSTQKIDKSFCEEKMDLLVQVAPLGCTPSIVTSDLLEEQDVEVYCPLSATKINSLLGIETIKDIDFSGKFSKEISSIKFFPAKKALDSETELDGSILQNIGYAKITIKKQVNESSMPEYVTGNLTAKVKYGLNEDMKYKNALFYLSEAETEEEIEAKTQQFSFWNEKGYLTLDSVELDTSDKNKEKASISLYEDDKRVSTVNLAKGETSAPIYLSGFECKASIKLRLDSFEEPTTMVRLNVNSEIVEVKKGGKFLDNKCSVESITDSGIDEQISIKCREDAKTNIFTLGESPTIKLKIGGENVEKSAGDYLYSDGSKRVYLGYVGERNIRTENENEKLFVYLIAIPTASFSKDKLTEKEISSISSLVGELIKSGTTKEGILEETETALRKLAVNVNKFLLFFGEGKSLARINYNEMNKIFGTEAILEGFAGAQNAKFASATARDNYENAIADYDLIINDFSEEEYETGESFGEKAMFDKITLANKYNQKLTASELCEEFNKEYPNSKENINANCKAYQLSNTKNSMKEVIINKKTIPISFEGVFAPSFNDYGARVAINFPSGNTEVADLEKEQKWYSPASSGTTEEYFQLVSLTETSAKIKTNSKYIKAKLGTDTFTLTKDELYQVKAVVKEGDKEIEKTYLFNLEEINLRKTAKVSLIPNIEESGTTADFKFSIGIEKRAITLAPEKIKEQIKDLNELINTTKGVSDVLGASVETLKTACLATGTALTLKSFIEASSSGAGISRQIVMRGSSGWFEKCRKIAEEKETSIDACLLENSEEIDAEVAEAGKIIDERNNKIKEIEKGATSEGMLGEQIVNDDLFGPKFTEQVYSEVSALNGDTITNPNKQTESVSKAKVLEILTSDNYEEKMFTIEELRDIELYATLSKEAVDSDLKTTANAKLYSLLKTITDRNEQKIELNSIEKTLDAYFKNPNVQVVAFDEKQIVGTYHGATTLGTFPAGVAAGTPIETLMINSFTYHVTLTKIPNSRDTYSIDKIYDYTGEVTLTSNKEIFEFIHKKYSSFKEYDASSYVNGYDNPILKYYETAPYKGVPAIVPINLNEGWYVAVKQILSAGSVQAFEANGRPTSFWLCNVGANKLEENRGGDDICQMINTNTGQKYDMFYGLGEVKAKELVDKAKTALEQAMSAYSDGVSGKMRILENKIQVGSPAVDAPEVQCQDYMSPTDCLLLFNLCDPVYCPSSRCDFGGAYPVKDVVQSGIIGSLALCLPNIQEGIVMPICLTGVKAGVENLISILSATRDCKQESLDTGKIVGICDETQSFYFCDLLYKEAIPLVNIATPKILEMLSGTNVRGGGEYASISTSWSLLTKSTDYFVNNYGANAKQAFLSRTTETLQGEICKLFVSATVPSGTTLLESLVKSDSPVQFTGSFDESVLTTASVPPTSHYKVAFHIFAGNDAGAYYQVYLKGSSSSSYYQDTSSSLNIASGYIPVGEYKSETIDKTANSGYKEMCISVNGQEECGFSEVSTDFAADYITDSYLKEQATTTSIKSDNECVSGTISAYSLLDLNLQSSIENLINPEIYTKGIIRVCATKNPGKGTDSNADTENSRWKEVGTCDDENIKCWIDTESIKSAIELENVEEESLDSVAKDYISILNTEGSYLREGVVEAIREQECDEDRIGTIENNLDLIMSNKDKASLLLLRAECYGKEPVEAKKEIALTETQTAVKAKENADSSEYNFIDCDTAIANANSWLDTSDNAPRHDVLVQVSENEGKASSQFDMCWSAVYNLYTLANVKLSTLFSETGKSYSNFKDMNNIVQTKTVVVDETRRTTGDKWVIFETNGEGKIIGGEAVKLAKLQAGDLISLAWNAEYGHNSIFLGWKDKASKTAYLFDWNGRRDANQISTGDNKVFRCYTLDISDSGHPVYEAWKPVKETEEETATEEKEKTTEETAAEEVEKETALDESSMRMKIFNAAAKIYGTGESTDRFTSAGSDYNKAGDSDAYLVSYTIKDAGTGISLQTGNSEFTRSNLQEKLEYYADNTDYFSEIALSSIEPGDIILVGDKCNMHRNIGVVFSKDSEMVSFYTTSRSQEHLEASNVDINIGQVLLNSEIFSKTYISKAFSYTGDLTDSEKADKLDGMKEKWTLMSALEKAFTMTGKYEENKDVENFVNELIVDGVLDEVDCSNGKYKKGMEEIRKILIKNCKNANKCVNSFSTFESSASDVDEKIFEAVRNSLISATLKNENEILDIGANLILENLENADAKVFYDMDRYWGVFSNTIKIKAGKNVPFREGAVEFILAEMLGSSEKIVDGNTAENNNPLKGYFSEVGLQKLQKGDILLLGKGCNKYISAGVVSRTSESSVLYLTIENKESSLKEIELPASDEKQEINLKNNYIYKAYRYTKEETTASKQLIAPERDKWTLANAKFEVNSWNSDDDYNLHSNIISQFFFDDVLTSDECSNIISADSDWNPFSHSVQKIKDLFKYSKQTAT